MPTKQGIITRVMASSQPTARVVFEDDDNLESYDLPIQFQAFGFAKIYCVPRVGMTAICEFLDESGVEDGFITGSFYNDAVPSQFSGDNLFIIAFDDGNFIKYENGGNMVLKSQNILLDGEVTVTGDVVAGGISLQKGGSSTGVPQ